MYKKEYESATTIIGTIKNAGIDTRLPTTDKDTQPVYVRIRMCANFKKYPSLDYLLYALILPPLQQQPFAKGVIKKDHHKHNTLDYTIHETAQEAAQQKRRYTLPTREPYIAFFYSVNAIGDTIIEIHDKS